MEVRKGYKQTEVGIIPIDWKCIESGESVTYFGGNSFKSEAAVNNGIKWLKIANAGKQRVHWKDISYLPLSYAKTFNDYLLREGDVVMALTRPILGRELKIAKLTILDVPSLLNQRVAKVIVYSETDLDFIYYILQARRFVNSMNDLMAGTDPPNIGSRTLKKILIAIPPTKEEQTAIAKVLSDTHDLIISLEKLIAKKRNIKQGSMQLLLTGKKRLPGFSGKWDKRRLGEIANIKTGGRNNEDKIANGKYPFFVRSTTLERINTYSYDCEAILVPGEGNIGNIFHYINARFDVHQRVYVISQFAPDINAKLIYLYMLMNFGTHAMQNSVKATVDSLRLPTFQEFELYIPKDKAEQTAIANILSDMDTEIEKLEDKLNKYKMIKQGMMQKLLTGQIRLI